MSALPKPTAAEANPRKLPKDYETRFSQVITCYERKDYKRGIKLADEILKKFPNHGETQAMKGLVLSCMEARTEAYEWVKLGLKNDIRSHVCWHVFGLIYRSDQNYKEASKCYLNALRINPNNKNILRDLSWLQIQLRDFDPYVTTRRKILEAQPQVRTNWVALAMAHYGAGEYESAFKVIEECNKVHKDDKDLPAYEKSEFLLFQNRCLEQRGLYQEAIDHMNEMLPHITDKLSYHVKTAELLQLLGQHQAAQEKWLFLLKDQPENYRYHTGFQTALLQLSQDMSREMFALKHLDLPSSVLELSIEQRQLLLVTYEKEEVLNQRSSATCIRKICFSILQGDAMLASLRNHLKIGIQKGIPALYQDVLVLVTIPVVSEEGDAEAGEGEKGKAVISNRRHIVCKEPMDFNAHPLVIQVRGWLDTWIGNLRSSATMDGDGAEETPQTLLWALFFQSHILERCGDIERSLLYIDECIAHTPTATDFYMRKARLLKKMGDVQAAAIVANEGRALDLQDRYLNNKAAKYAFRANHVNQGYELMALFARHEGDPQQYLAEQQCTWYELEVGQSLARQKLWGGALKKFYSIHKHYVDYCEDMFDFHAFCVRKTSLRSHEAGMVFQYSCWAHPYFQTALRGALEIFIHLIDDPDDIDGLGHLNPKERKKEREKRKKQKIKDAKAEEARIAEEAAEQKRFGSSSTDVPKPDVDPNGETYLSRNFLEEAGNWVTKVTPHYHVLEPETLSLISEVHIKRNKPLQAIRVLSIGLKRYPQHPALTPALLRLYMRLTTKVSKSQKNLSQNQFVLQASKDEFKQEWLFGKDSAHEYVDILIGKAYVIGSSISQRFAAARCKMILEVNSEYAQNVVLSLLDTEDLWSSRGVNVKAAEMLVRQVQHVLGMAELANRLCERTKVAFPMARFGSLCSADDVEQESDKLPPLLSTDAKNQGTVATATNTNTSDMEELP